MSDAETKLTPHREKLLEASVARFQELEQIVEDQARRIRELEHEISLSDLENKQLNIYLHDERERVRIAERLSAQAVADRVAYEVIFIQIAHMATQFQPPVPMTEITVGQEVHVPGPNSEEAPKSLCEKCYVTSEDQIDVCPKADCPNDRTDGRGAVAKALGGLEKTSGEQK